MWTETLLLDAVDAAIGSIRPLHLLRQVEVEDRRIDAIAVLGDRRVAIEAKISRADFRREHDAKRAPSWRAAHGCVYLCPPGVVTVHDLPAGWGLWYATGPAQLRVEQEPSWHEPDRHAADALSTTLARRAADLERRVRAAEALDDPLGALVALSDDVERLGGLLAQRDTAVARERARAQDAAEQVLALVGSQSCGHCDGAITYTRTGSWRHVEAQQQVACERSRAEAERQRRKALTGSEYRSVQAPRIVPAGVPTPR